MTRKPGFTIIELVIAAAVSVMLVSVALPRYVAFSRQQDFANASQDLVDCLRQAQSAASSPRASDVTAGSLDNSARYVAVVLKASGRTADPKTTTVNCESFYIRGIDSVSGKEVTPTTLSDRIKSGGITSVVSIPVKAATKSLGVTLVSQHVTNGTTDLSVAAKDPMSSIIIFDATNRGVPIIACAMPGQIGSSYECPFVTNVLSQGGLEIKLSLEGIEPVLRGTITIGTLGTPIQYDPS